jgi:nucleotide-binding universal stress UspA family protein
MSDVKAISSLLIKVHEPDIIALGGRGLTPVKALLLGSVAERVARYANCSVLIGRAHSVDNWTSNDLK